MAVEMFVWVFWLTTFALYADFVASTLAYMGDTYSSYSSSSSGQKVCYAGYCVSYKRDLTKRYTDTDPVAAVIYTALALSVINL